MKKKNLMVNSKKVCYKTILNQFNRLIGETNKGGQRTSTQVICNGLFATLFSALYIKFHGCGELKIDFTNNFEASYCTVAILGT